MSQKTILPIQYHQYNKSHPSVKNAEIIVETPVSLTVNGENWLSFMCTPNELEALAVGFLFNEGVIQKSDEVESVRVCIHGDNIDVWLSHSVKKPDSWLRTSGCTGGVTSINPAEIHKEKFALHNRTSLTPKNDSPTCFQIIYQPGSI